MLFYFVIGIATIIQFVFDFLSKPVSLAACSVEASRFFCIAWRAFGLKTKNAKAAAITATIIPSVMMVRLSIYMVRIINQASSIASSFLAPLAIST